MNPKADPLVMVGRAGWSLPKEHKPLFPEDGTHLSRYAAVLPAVEINSSSYRHHRERTYRRWADSVPDRFRFAVKVSNEITHKTRLRMPPLLDEFLAGPRNLGNKLGPLLVQLPPSLDLDVRLADAFFRELRERRDGPVVCEPRHVLDESGEVWCVFDNTARNAAIPNALRLLELLREASG